MPTRPYLFYALTNSVCSQCLTKVEAKIIFWDDRVYLERRSTNNSWQTELFMYIATSTGIFITTEIITLYIFLPKPTGWNYHK